MPVLVIAWTYEADVHCLACAYDRFGPRLWAAEENPPIDNEGNLVHPIFNTDDEGTLICGDCLGEILE